MSDVETQLKEFRDKLKRYQKVFRGYQEYKVGMAPEGFNVDEERQLREELNETWGELENTIIRLWGERPKQAQYNSVFPVFETALSGNFESPLTGGAIASAIQVVIKCIGKAKSSPELVYKKASPVADSGSPKNMKSIFSKQNYKDMDWNKLVAEAKRQKLDPRLYSFKGVEGAGECDRIEIIRQLNDLDQQNKVIKPRWWEKTWIQILMVLGAVAGIIGLVYSLKLIGG